jgi:8-oxo-dGTP pyrophosphatase MutT (NUDIX family)
MNFTIKEKLKLALAAREKVNVIANGEIVAAVLVPLFYKEGECHVLLTRRTNTVKTSKGQISFPGGACEPEDKTLLDTALRGTAEEVGIPSGEVEVLGELDDASTATFGYLISPFVGVIPYPYPLKPEPAEIEEILEVPISTLLDPQNFREAVWERSGRKTPVEQFDYKGHIIWGLTCRILKNFLPIWVKVNSREGL